MLHPSGPNPAPEKWILEWPPGTSAGYYTGLPLLPPDATAISFKIGMDLRTYGGSTIPLEFKWQNIPVKDEWKSADAVWEADVGEATEEELAAQRRMTAATPCDRVITMNTAHSPFLAAADQPAKHLMSV